MRFVVRIIALILVSFSLMVAANGQSRFVLEEGVKHHEDIDRIYSEFSLAYATLDAEKVAGLYANDASYVPPSRDIVPGRAAILDSFKGFFANIKERGQSMAISFRIEKRRVEKDLGYDIGVFEIEFSEGGSVVGNSKGRFVVVTVKDPDGKWRFDVDAYTPLEDK